MEMGLSDVCKLESSEQWWDWERQMITYLIIEDFDDLLGAHATRPVPTQGFMSDLDVEKSDADCLLWEERQQTACRDVCSRLSHDVRAHTDGLCTVKSIMDELNKRMMPAERPEEQAEGAAMPQEKGPIGWSKAGHTMLVRRDDGKVNVNSGALC